MQPTYRFDRQPNNSCSLLALTINRILQSRQHFVGGRIQHTPNVQILLSNA